MVVVAPNITAGPNGTTTRYRIVDWVRTVRHGVKPNGNPVLIMPSEDYSRLSDEDAYNVVKTLIEKKDDIVKVHKEADSFSLDNQVQDRSPVPFHPGALKYFKEKGVGG